MAQEQTPDEALEIANALISGKDPDYDVTSHNQSGGITAGSVSIGGPQDFSVVGTNNAKKKVVVFRAPVLTASGYGVHSRQIFRWLMSKDNLDIYTETLQWGNTTWLIDPKAEGGLVGDVMFRSKKREGLADLSIQVQLPNEWDSTLAKQNIGITAAVETDKCNPAWVEACNKMDLVIVPSEHTKATLTRSGELRIPIVVVPESYIPEIETVESSLDLELDTSFNFLMVGQITGNNAENDRKNTYNTLKWLCETFKGDKDVGIILKSNSSRNTHIDRRFTERNIKACLKQVRSGPYPKVHLLHGLMNNEEMASLYRHPNVKAFVALSRGEGFCLPLLEAAASGIPIIATDWSGHLDFMNKGRFIKVDYDLQNIPASRQDKNIWMEGTKWAEPKEGSAKKVLKKFRKSSDIPRGWAKDLQKTILEDYSHKAICSHYDSVLLEFITT